MTEISLLPWDGVEFFKPKPTCCYILMSQSDWYWHCCYLLLAFQEEVFVKHRYHTRIFSSNANIKLDAVLMRRKISTQFIWLLFKEPKKFKLKHSLFFANFLMEWSDFNFVWWWPRLNELEIIIPLLRLSSVLSQSKPYFWFISHIICCDLW